MLEVSKELLFMWVTTTNINLLEIKTNKFKNINSLGNDSKPNINIKVKFYEK